VKRLRGIWLQDAGEVGVCSRLDLGGVDTQMSRTASKRFSRRGRAIALIVDAGSLYAYVDADC
jgi:hypothetical protein